MRRIIHLDLDAFFASVEQLDHPELRGKPVIVGGTSERGVVATCSYEARVYGVRSAMPNFQAKKLCPKGIFVNGSYARYSEISDQVFEIFSRYTDTIQPVSIDEAYLDMSHRADEAVIVARMIKEDVKREIGITISAGISYNKFLAKLASDWNKPDGLMLITPDMVPDILLPLSVSKVHGLGKKSVEKLNRIGIFTIGDLMKYDRDFLIEYMGKYGSEVYDRIRGIDDRPVRESSKRKSYGKETTFKEDTIDKEKMKEVLDKFIEKIVGYLERKNFSVKTLTVKYKTVSFQSHTKSKTVGIALHRYEDIKQVSDDIIDSIDFEEAIRLIGISGTNFEDRSKEQISIFDM